jgi:hypothetical protein
LTDQVSSTENREKQRWKIFSTGAVGLIAMSLVFIGLNAGFTFNPADYTPTKYPYFIKWLYVLGPFFLVGLLLLNEIIRSKVAVITFLFIVALWNPAYNGGWAYDYEKDLVAYCEDMYRAASALENVQADKFGVYVNAFKEIEYPERILWVYKYFVDERHARGQGYDALYRYNALMDKSVLYIPGERKLDDVPGNVLVTDQVQTVRNYYPEANVIQKIPWGKELLVVLNLVPKH